LAIPNRTRKRVLLRTGCWSGTRTDRPARPPQPPAALTVPAQFGRRLGWTPLDGADHQGLCASPERQIMTRMLFALSLGFAGLIHATQTVQAEAVQPRTIQTPLGPACGLRARVLDRLAQRYGETRRGIGLAANNTVMEVFASADTGSWSITVTLPDGVTCLMASGQGFEAMTEELPAKGDPA